MFRVRIRELREQHGYRSQQAFATAFGVAQTTVAGWEGGKREPNYETTMRLADFFGVSVDSLLGHYWYSSQPISMLCGMYGIEASELAFLCSLDPSEAERWAIGSCYLAPGEDPVTLHPQGQLLETLSDFFEIPPELLSQGRFPCESKASVWQKVFSLKLRLTNSSLFVSNKKPTGQAGEFPKSERDLLDLFHRLNADGQKALLDYANLLTTSGQFSPAENVQAG